MCFIVEAAGGAEWTTRRLISGGRGGDVVEIADDAVSFPIGCAGVPRHRLEGSLRLNVNHLLLEFNQLDRLERCALRLGNVHSADNREEVLQPINARRLCPPKLGRYSGLETRTRDGSKEVFVRGYLEAAVTDHLKL